MSRPGASDRAALDATTVLYNVSIIPARDVSNNVRGLSRQLAGMGGLFEIDNADRHAHATLYMARFRPEILPELLGRIGKAIGGTEPIRLTHDGYFLTPGSYYEVSYRREPRLLAAHDKIMLAARSLRHIESPPVVEDYYGPFSADQQANVRRYGYDLAGALYRPHITITRFADRAPAEPPVADTDLSFTAHTIGVFRADHLGAARELIQTFDLTEALATSA